MKKKKQKQTNKFHEIFSPTILETQVPNRFVDIINATGDDVLSSEQKSAKWDWSHKLVGKVSKEIQIPVDDADDRVFLFKTMKQGCLNYINYIMLNLQTIIQPMD